MASGPSIDTRIIVYSNDGSTTLYYRELFAWNTTEIRYTVTSTGITFVISGSDGNDETVTYTYAGNGTFLGVSLYARAAEPFYAVGGNTVLRTGTSETILYIVEEIPRTIKGLWRWKDNPTRNWPAEGERTQDISFTSNGKQYTKIAVGSAVIDGATVDKGTINYYEDSSTGEAAWLANTGWSDPALQLVDFGSTEQNVSGAIYNYIAANADQLGICTIRYNGKQLISLDSDAGVVTLTCAGKKALTNIEIVSEHGATVTYNGEEISGGNAFALACAGKKMLTNVDVTVKVAEYSRQLAAPTISLSGTTLTMKDNSGGLATAYKIYNNGKLKTTQHWDNAPSDEALNISSFTTIGDNVFTVVVTAAGYVASEYSNTVTYTVSNSGSDGKG